MASREWKQWCRGQENIVLNDDCVVVILGGRHCRVEVVDAGEAYELTGIAARRAALQSIPDFYLRAWRRNRTTRLVGFRVDPRGRLVGEAWVPKAGLSQEEFLHYVRHVASECDRFGFILTGKVHE
ncbi:MAG: YbjN domain-containing protein [Syntrophorhabdales bacterium]|jgi:hypothetical protein